MKNYIPGCFSVFNLISGAIGTVLALNGHLSDAAYCIFFGGGVDFLDGFIARLLNAETSIGKQLDSLADMVTFGMAPAGIIYMLIKAYETCPYRPYAALFVVVFSALRLAKFTIDQRQRDRFIGLPTPANALLIATLPIILSNTSSSALVYVLKQPLVLPLLTIFLSLLLVSNVTFISLKFQGASFRSNRSRYFLISLWILLVAVMHVEGIFWGTWIYILVSLFINMLLKLFH